MKKTRNNLEFSIIFRTFAIVMITIATIGSGSEKPEQAQFSLALHDGCIIEINPIYSHFKNTQQL